MTPLTPTERAALDAAKASFDAERLAYITAFDGHKRFYETAQRIGIGEKRRAENGEKAQAFHLAATILARQVAERLTIG